MKEFASTRVEYLLGKLLSEFDLVSDLAFHHRVNPLPAVDKGHHALEFEVFALYASENPHGRVLCRAEGIEKRPFSYDFAVGRGLIDTVDGLFDLFFF